ncbi:MAG: hypothetical protein M1813_002099 [Trichoglossum hirsutum]|nr:MAG: hypothetical protein M1813_002099 [Trichoglossum hirsutum]
MEAAAVTILFDVIIFSIPVPILAKIQIKPRRKYALMGVFLLGLFTTVCSILRMVQIIRISRDGNSTGLVLWGTIEMNVGISLTCLPTLTPLFKRIAQMTTYGDSDNLKDNYHLEALSRGAASVRRPQRSMSRHDRTNESKDSILCDNSLYQPPSPSGTLGDRESGRREVGIAKMTELNINVIPVTVDSD